MVGKFFLIGFHFRVNLSYANVQHYSVTGCNLTTDVTDPHSTFVALIVPASESFYKD